MAATIIVGGGIGAGVTLSPNAMRGIADLGVADAVIAAGVQPAQQRIQHWYDGRTLVTLKRSDMRAQYGAAYVYIHRAATRVRWKMPCRSKSRPNASRPNPAPSEADVEDAIDPSVAAQSEIARDAIGPPVIIDAECKNRSAGWLSALPCNRAHHWSGFGRRCWTGQRSRIRPRAFGSGRAANRRQAGRRFPKARPVGSATGSRPKTGHPA